MLLLEPLQVPKVGAEELGEQLYHGILQLRAQHVLTGVQLETNTQTNCIDTQTNYEMKTRGPDYGGVGGGRGYFIWGEFWVFSG